MAEHHSYGFIGAGAIGQALGASLRKTGCSVEFWDLEPNRSTVTSPQELIEASSVIIISIPSKSVREILQRISSMLSKDKHIVLTVAKGVEKDFIPMSEVLADELHEDMAFGVLYGPMLAGELQAGEGGYGVLALNKPIVAPEVIQDFAGGNVIIEASEKLRDVAICGVLKNIYSLALGMADGLDFGMNTKAQLSVRIIEEMQLVLHRLQLSPGVTLLSCGIGDLLATGWGDASYNHHVGEEIAAGNTSQLGGEGLHALMELPSVLEVMDFPILRCLYQVVTSQIPAEDFRGCVR